MARTASISRQTSETKVDLKLDIDGTGKFSIKTGVGFFDHMLEQLSKHALIDLEIAAEGDLHIDAHHTVEDVGICLGLALKEAVGDKRGVFRYGSSVVVMDEARSRVDLDFSGRAYCVWRAQFAAPMIGALDTQLISHFFDSVAKNAGLTLHIENDYGDNDHHIAESIFKAAARAMRAALTIDDRAAGALPSTKGVL
ncbi:MAG: imidazoleglycerol-phosphate dehydratase HisB [Neomegalonema sp.]|nr:imidazoleglycerol-phosphate dehydratase HisB [Neomegalonema sp.]